MKNSSLENISEDSSYCEDISAQKLTQDENLEEKSLSFSKVVDDDTNYLVRNYHVSLGGKIKVLGLGVESEENFKLKTNGPYHINENGVLERLLSSEDLKEYDLTKPVDIREVINENIQGTSKERNNPKYHSLEAENQEENVDINSKSKSFFQNPLIQRIKNSLALPLQITVRKKEENNKIRVNDCD
ncbi:hypothetical protein HNY73_012136 [Argiope bruennichi]|uniref:Uncharacterized protein n=1 Tax=Argiope bruennichi TaxID=94029 RepID=A0A8T0EVJ6_ARGBR|nr:hypothetical protein HNY73_012136 [Argiope bruennichi]